MRLCSPPPSTTFERMAVPAERVAVPTLVPSEVKVTSPVGTAPVDSAALVTTAVRVSGAPTGDVPPGGSTVSRVALICLEMVSVSVPELAARGPSGT